MRPPVLSDKQLPMNGLSLDDLYIKLKQLMISNGLKGDEVAEKSGFYASMISDMLNGKFPNREINTITKVAGAIGYKITFNIVKK